jgi:hypothetical protein
VSQQVVNDERQMALDPAAVTTQVADALAVRLRNLLADPRVKLLLHELINNHTLVSQLDGLLQDLLDVVDRLLDKPKLIAAIDGPYILRLQHAIGIPPQYLERAIERLANLADQTLASAIAILASRPQDP